MPLIVLGIYGTLSARTQDCWVHWITLSGWSTDSSYCASGSLAADILLIAPSNDSNWNTKVDILIETNGWMNVKKRSYYNNFQNANTIKTAVFSFTFWCGMTKKQAQRLSQNRNTWSEYFTTTWEALSAAQHNLLPLKLPKQRRKHNTDL